MHERAVLFVAEIVPDGKLIQPLMMRKYKFKYLIPPLCQELLSKHFVLLTVGCLS